MSNGTFDDWKRTAVYLEPRTDNHNKILNLGRDQVGNDKGGPYRPIHSEELGTTTFCNRAATMLNRITGINSPLLSTEKHSGPSILNVNKDSFMANQMCRNLNREANRLDGQVIKVPQSIAQLVANNFSEVLAGRRGDEHGHVAWINPGHDPSKPDAPFLTNVGSDVRVKPWHESHNDLEYFSFRNDPFPQRVVGELLGKAGNFSSEASWLKGAIETAHRQLQQGSQENISDVSHFIKKAIFDRCKQEITMSYPYIPHPFTDLCNMMRIDVNRMTPPGRPPSFP